ncbi:Selenoprotein H [Trichoplax sp. H2]|nr:Selenoprotein H [Trichoplax sp. H2]|eukprot:RDD45983.1 Selenoprotein H [Trichoplax sp. H2]
MPPKKRKVGEKVARKDTAASDDIGETGKKRKRTKVQTNGQFIIERCDELVKALQTAFPKIESQVNPEKPRRGSFECYLSKEDGDKILLWSGIKLGPPRKLKFPDPDVIVKAAKEAIQTTTAK